MAVVRRRSGGGGGGVKKRRWGRRALVALSEEAKGFNLMDEIDHTGPPAKPEPDNQHPHHHEHVYYI